MNPARTLTAVLGSVLVFRLLDYVLELSVVGPVADTVAYYAARNQPFVLGARLLYTPFIGVLAGYTCAKFAGKYELAHTAAAAALLVTMMGYGFTKEPGAQMTPTWIRIALIVLAPAGIGLGGYIRARAAQLQS
jgi:hypothetical protein